jgi:glycosyltransferase involved in cell wall biosynthesis
MGGSAFGGSEELWTRTARLLAQQGVRVAASVQGWPELDRRITDLARAGVDLRPRPLTPSLMGQIRRYASGQPRIVLDVERSFGGALPNLVVISNGTVLPPIELAELCIAKSWRFVTVAHSNSPYQWPSDELAARWRKVLPVARRCFFVSDAIRDLAQWQLGYDIENAEIVRNPLLVKSKSPLPWPSQAVEQELRMACVGTLFPNEKGQDILLEALARPCWRLRNWRLTFYGSGPNRDIIDRLVTRFDLKDRVCFGGHVAIEEIWQTNHLLVLPSRYEGAPMVTVEAMWCGRPVVATNVGFNPQLIKDGVTGFLAEAAVAECFGKALERMWVQRDRLEDIGRFAAVGIRDFVPNDPIGIFVEKLKSIAEIQNAHYSKISGAGQPKTVVERA